jgi:thiol-disulfide isomerase/thioredoxin
MPKQRRKARPAPARPDRSGMRVATILISVALLSTAALVVLRVRSAPPPPPRARPTASDLAAPRSLIRAARAVGFSPTTEPGVGQVEGDPASSTHPAHSKHLLKQGSLAPSFTLRTPQGQAVTVPEAGRPTLLEFFATWCPHCAAEAPHLRGLALQFGSRAAFVSVNADSEDRASVYAFHRYFGLPYPALVDPSGSPRGSFHEAGGLGRWATTYGVEAYPTVYVIDANGRVAWAGDGEQPDALLHQMLVRAGA